MASEPIVGSHLVTPMAGYTHHGVYIGDGMVVHYSGRADGFESGSVEEVNLRAFSSGRGFVIKTYKNSFAPDVVIARAKSRIGESFYSVFSSNCEHFCLWCIVGNHTSDCGPKL